MKFRYYLAVVLLTCFGFASHLFAKGKAARPNVVLIFADDLGINDISCFGSEIATPNIDSLARDGMKLEQFYVASPICTPSRFGLLTGTYPNRSKDNLHGALMYLMERDDHRGIRQHETTIAKVLKKNGYRTALIGKWHLGHNDSDTLPGQHGFDYTYGSQGGCVDYFTTKYGYKPDWFRNAKPLVEAGYTTDLITDDALRYLKQQKKSDPFFLFLSYTAPHYGKGWDEETKQLTNILQAKPEDRARFKNIKDTNRLEYAAMVASMDDGIGRVLQALKNQKLDKNTLVIFTSDNGGDPRYGGSNDPFRGRKAQLFEGGIRVPCLMRWPGKIKAGTVSQQPATTLDFFPTFSALAGIRTEGRTLDGSDISSVLLQGKEFKRDLFWKLPSADALRRSDWKYVRAGKEEFLFDLATDPIESKNLASEKPNLLKELKTVHATVAATIK
ncbi:MAG: sulfatase-like hydrolase/transferase [Verrucomicrobia bacterium]|nr:sulfatase-like hydrolase/transferase [Verrucomicrobiota bacterium]